MSATTTPPTAATPPAQAAPGSPPWPGTALAGTAKLEIDGRVA